MKVDAAGGANDLAQVLEKQSNVPEFCSRGRQVGKGHYAYLLRAPKPVRPAQRSALAIRAEPVQTGGGTLY